MNEIMIYRAIGPGGIDAQEFAEALKAMDKSEPVVVRINSTGGDVFAGLAMYNALSQFENVEVHIDGLAASMASVVAMAGKKVFMAANALMMIHKPWSNSAGNADDLREQAELLDRVETQLIKVYTKKSGLPENQVQKMLSKETWLEAEEALELGLIDEISEESQMAAQVDLSVFNSVPDTLNKKLIQERITEIKSMVAGVESSLPEAFISKITTDPKLSVEEARKQIMAELGKDNEPLGGPPVMTEANNQKQFINDATDALLIRSGVNLKQVTNGARDLAKYSIANIAESYLRLGGVATAGFSNDQIISKVFEIKASHSTSDFPQLLENTAAKSMRIAYMEEPSSHVVWTGETEVPDFKQQSLVQISEAPDLELVPEGGEYKHGTLGDEAEKFHVETYGKMFKITRQALINDDLQAFTRLPQAFGQSARRKEADMVYQVLTSNLALSDGTALFHADHGNVLAVSGSMTLDVLGQGRTKMRKQKGPAGLQPLNIVPRFLIVPAALETTAEQLIASIVDPTKSNDTPNAEFIRGLTLVVDSRLDENSETKFYLAANPGQIDTITRAYLMNEGRPYIETRDGWEVDAMEIKCRLDFAAVPVDYRGLVEIDIA